MVMQLTDQDGRQVRALLDVSFDAELNDGDMDFEISLPVAKYDDRMKEGCRVFIKDTEIGGILGRVKTSTSKNTITWKGYTWRGRLAKKIIVPPDGQDRYTVNGELNDILRELIEPIFDGVFLVPEIDTGVSIEYEFDRFCSLLDGITKMLKSVGYRPDISYNEGEPNGSGWAEVSAVPINDYSDEIELSQDSRIHFTMEKIVDGVNHLIVGGKGEMQERNVLHLYVQEDGTIGYNKYFDGIEEIEEFYENTSTDSEDLESVARKKLESLMNSQTFDMDVESLGIDVKIGDIVGGRDYITGMYMAKPVANIIVKIEGEKIEKEYIVEGV